MSSEPCRASSTTGAGAVATAAVRLPNQSQRQEPRAIWGSEDLASSVKLCCLRGLPGALSALQRDVGVDRCVIACGFDGLRDRGVVREQFAVLAAPDAHPEDAAAGDLGI